MCYSNPAKSLALAEADRTPEQWAKFEADFEHFRAYSGLQTNLVTPGEYTWAKWAFFSGGSY